MIGFLHPELLLLGVPLALAWWTWRGTSRATAALRLVVAALLLVALAGPYMRTPARGRDLVVVFDRSLSMPAESEASALELIRLAEERRAPGDRIAVVGFGRDAAIEQLPLETARFQGFESAVEPDSSDLAEALDTALGLIPEDRQGGILLISDGEANGADPLAAARRAFARGVHVDTRAHTREGSADLSVSAFELPEEVAAGEPFQFSAWVLADERVEARFRLERRGELLTSGTRTFEPGRNRLLFRDVVPAAGVVDYRLRLLPAPGTPATFDRVPENDVGLGAVLVRGPRPLLLLNHDGAEDTLSSALARSGLAVVARAPEQAPLDAVALTAYRAVVLENVAAGRLGYEGMKALRDFVVERGGGLLVTGGRASFGVGGYHLSPVDDVLPVSMELREEHRKQAVALVVALDRSGSMGAGVQGGRTKMDLANQGTASAVELLSSIDSVGVLAVDSQAHVVQELTAVEDPRAIARRALGIEAGGGGIYTYEALLAAARMLDAAPQVNRHVILFADAADAEQQEGCFELVADLATAGVTLSVIALGTERDQHAAFLRALAEAGSGELYITTSAEELPRLFAMDTLMAARSAFVDQPTDVEARPALIGLGGLAPDAMPPLGGYNLTYAKDGAEIGAVTLDERHAPVFAFAYEGLGRAAAWTGQIGGTFGEAVTAWPEFSAFFVTVARWLVGQEEPTELYPSVRREGRDAVVAVEVDPEAAAPPDTSALAARLRSPDGSLVDVPLERVGEHRFEARHALVTGGITLGTVRLDAERFVTLPPLSLPYSPEFEHTLDPGRGERLLRRIAAESGGTAEVLADDLFRGSREGSKWRLVANEVLGLAVVLFLLEIAGRRLGLWAALQGRARRRAERARARADRELLEAERARRVRRAADEPALPDPEAHDPWAAEEAARRREEAAPAAAERDAMAEALERARRSAGKRLDR